MYYDMMKESMSSVQSSNQKPKGILKKSIFKRSPISSPSKLLHDLKKENSQEENRPKDIKMGDFKVSRTKTVN